MKKYMLFLSLLFIVMGILLGRQVYTNYKDFSVFNDAKTIYFLELENKIDLDSIPNIKINNKGIDHIYLAITYNRETAIKIKELYKERDVDLKIIDKHIDDEFYYNALQQYDILLYESNNLEEIYGVLDTILATYNDSL